MAKPVKEVRISPDPVSPEPRSGRESARLALRKSTSSSCGNCECMHSINYTNGACISMGGFVQLGIDHAVFSCTAGRRSAMGEYVPPPGGKPLSSHCESVLIEIALCSWPFIDAFSIAIPKPSPADYGGVAASAKTTLPRSPSYSMQSRPYPLTSEYISIAQFCGLTVSAPNLVLLFSSSHHTWSL